MIVVVVVAWVVVVVAAGAVVVVVAAGPVVVVVDVEVVVGGCVLVDVLTRQRTLAPLLRRRRGRLGARFELAQDAAGEIAGPQPAAQAASRTLAGSDQLRSAWASALTFRWRSM